MQILGKITTLLGEILGKVFPKIRVKSSLAKWLTALFLVKGNRYFSFSGKINDILPVKFCLIWNNFHFFLLIGEHAEVDIDMSRAWIKIFLRSTRFMHFQTFNILKFTVLVPRVIYLSSFVMWCCLGIKTCLRCQKKVIRHSDWILSLSFRYVYTYVIACNKRYKKYLNGN